MRLPIWRWTVAAALATLSAGGASADQAPAAAPPGAAAAQQPATGVQPVVPRQQPIGATPLSDDEVQRVHTIEKRPFTEAGRWEVTLFAPVQVNAKFTTHFGGAFELAYHLRENLAAQIGVGYMPIAHMSTFSEELINKTNTQPVAANVLLLQANALAGLEFMPVYGKISVFDGKILRLGFYLNAGIGAAKTQLQITPDASRTGRIFGDTGFRPMAGLGAGFRVFVTETFTVRLELRDLVYSAYVNKVSGCTYADTAQIGQVGTAAQVSQGCNVAAFGSNNDDAKFVGNVAAQALKDPSADIINNVAFFGGVSYLF